jgi:hypothetical protein
MSVLLDYEGRALAEIERHAVALPDGLVEWALREVLSGGERADGFSAGRVDDALELPPAAGALDRILREELIDPLGSRHGLEFELSFMKAGDGDAPPEQAFAPSAMPSAPRVFRVLVNLSEYPRRALLWDGAHDRAAEEVVVPGRRCGAVHSLHYWASAVPHCGVNDALGFFLAAYEAPGEPPSGS